MNRMHIHLGVENLEKSIKFYSALFGAAPVKTKIDYAKWMLESPQVNFAISTNVDVGVNHLGIQVDEDQELTTIRERLKNADMSLIEEGETTCCYARSDKSWVIDPSNIPWEAYTTMEDVEFFGENPNNATAEEACCVPETKGQPGCCVPSEKTVGCCE